MVFAPVGIRCPDHASVGAVKPNAGRTVRQVRGSITRTGNPVTAALVAINVVVFLITLSQGSGGQPGGKLFTKGELFVSLPCPPGFTCSFSNEGLAHGEWWRLFTAMFLHGSFLHIAFNMFALWWLGSVVEQSLGAVRYLLLYIASGLAGSTGAIISAPHSPTVGASGAIFGLLGALLVLEYLQTGSFAGQAMTLIIINLALSFAIPNISIGGHIGGLIGGIAGTGALVATRYRRPRYIGPALVVLVAVVSVAIAVSRARGNA
jgi:membrane associated rhomboid family serine protease